jgi:hypothetical protein
VRFESIDLEGVGAGRAVFLSFRPRVEVDDEHPAGQVPVGPVGDGFGETLHLLVAVPARPHEQLLAAVLTAMAFGGLALLLLVGVAVWVSVRLGLAPVHRFAERLRGLDAHNLDRLEPATVPAELQPFQEELHGLLQRLDEAFERADGSRSDRRHHGLGLSPVERVLVRCGMELELALVADIFQVRIRKSRRKTG